MANIKSAIKRVKTNNKRNAAARQKSRLAKKLNTIANA
ncbi:MAG: hypothetical protein K0S34_1316 [Bacillales bacterium]|nr:hypothetical protein [Bacillales bacterium]